MATTNSKVTEFVTALKRRRTTRGSLNLAKQTIEVLRSVVTSSRWTSANDLIDIVRQVALMLDNASPSEHIVGNVSRRVLRLIRDAYITCVDTDKEAPASGNRSSNMPSLHQMLVAPVSQNDLTTPYKALKSVIVQSINDLLEEIEESGHNIASQALEHIHSDEVIMTLGHSSTVEAFLKTAAAKRSFQVIVAEGAPNYEGQKLAKALGEAGVETTLITDSAIFAMMSRVNKVIIGTTAVMADGGLMAANGCHALTLAAKHHSVPVLVCAAMFKLYPRYICSYDQDSFNSLSSPTQVAQYYASEEKMQCLNPMFDYVPPDLVNLFVSNIGGNAPSYVYRLLNEYYSEEDYTLEEA